MDQTTIRRSVAAYADSSLAPATRYQMLNRSTPTYPGRWPGGQRTGVNDGLDKRKRPAGTLMKLVSRPIRAFVRLFVCAPGAPQFLSVPFRYLNKSDSDPGNPSELTLVPDSSCNKELDEEKVCIMTWPLSC